jgi:hypothetical protein
MDRVHFLYIGDKRIVTFGNEFDTHRMLVFIIWINVLHIYDLFSVSGELVANRASSAAQAAFKLTTVS